MDKTEFEREVKRRLKGLEKEQVISFAWRCAVRALPFLGSKGHFDAWKKELQETHLWKVLKTLDAAKAYSSIAPSTYLYIINDAIETAADVLVDVYRDEAIYGVKFNKSEYLAVATSASSAASAASAASSLSAVSSATSAAVAVAYLKNDMLQLILADLEALKSGKSANKDVTFYAAIWPNFMKALEHIDCAYWGHLYKDIIESGFQLDPKALERRLNVPIEIQNQGAAAVAHYLEELEKKGAIRLNEARVVILGEKGAGKTCLARRLKNPQAEMTTDRESTPGVDTHLWELEEEDLSVRIWDFAGHTVTHAVHQFFLSERCLYIMVYDGRSESRNRLRYWLDHMKNYGGNSKAIILINRRDDHDIEIPVNQLREEYSILDVCEFNIKEDTEKLDEFRKMVAQHIKNNPSWKKQEIPVSYYRVKEELEQLFVKGDINKGQEHIRLVDFKSIARKHEVEDVEQLMEDLHHLGVSLWYKDLAEFDTMILNPEWISHGVYRIINWVHGQKRHSIHLDDFSEVFGGDGGRYPVSKHSFLFKLIKHYKLAYQTKGTKTLIIPHLMAEDRPDHLPLFSESERLVLRYRADQPLPPNTISLFIVEHNKEILKQDGTPVVWRYGVALCYKKNTLALVREEDRTISVFVKGEYKTEYISKLRHTLNEIFDAYKSKKPKLEYRVEREPDLTSIANMDEKAFWLENQQIMNLVSKNLPFFDHITSKQVPMNEVARNFNINLTINAEKVMIGQGHNMSHEESHTTINFKDCNVSLQGSLNTLGRKLAKVDEDEAEEVQEVVEALQDAKTCESPEAAKEKGLDKVLGKWMRDLGNEDSKLHKTVAGLKKGASIAQDIAAEYNKVAQWLGMPQVPQPFLKG